MRMDINEICNRKRPVLYEKVIKENSYSQLVNRKVIKKYKYYICDYCHQEITEENQVNGGQKSGGLLYLPSTVTHTKPFWIVLHNKCVKSALKELEDKGF